MIINKVTANDYSSHRNNDNDVAGAPEITISFFALIWQWYSLLCPTHQ